MKRSIFMLIISAAILITFLFLNCPTVSEEEEEKESINYNAMVAVSTGSYNQSNGTDSFNHTLSGFSIGKYEVTYSLWYSVYQWASANSYYFQSAGREGNDGTVGAAPTAAGKFEPVTGINWRDAIVWCNAFSQKSGLSLCYTYTALAIKDSRDSNATACDNAACSWTANGYRLPSEGEWQFAATGRGAIPWNYASGAAAASTNAIETAKVAWYSSNSGGSTRQAGTTANSSSLSLWDVSGNVWEWCWDWEDDYPVPVQIDYRGPSTGTSRIARGGSWGETATYLRVGYRGYDLPGNAYNERGFRIARTN